MDLFNDELQLDGNMAMADRCDSSTLPHDGTRLCRTWPSPCKPLTGHCELSLTICNIHIALASSFCQFNVDIDRRQRPPDSHGVARVRSQRSTLANRPHWRGQPVSTDPHASPSRHFPPRLFFPHNFEEAGRRLETQQRDP